MLRAGTHDGCQSEILDGFRLDLTADALVPPSIGDVRRSDEATGLVVGHADSLGARADTELLDNTGWKGNHDRRPCDISDSEGFGIEDPHCARDRELRLRVRDGRVPVRLHLVVHLDVLVRNPDVISQAPRTFDSNTVRQYATTASPTKYRLACAGTEPSSTPRIARSRASRASARSDP